MSEELDEAYDIKSTRVESPQEVVEDVDAVTNIIQLLDAADSLDVDVASVQYKGSTVKSDVRDLMVHIVDKMHDHFG